ncbi:MAG: DUF2330 domain-containing protein [Alphaproteobacteria bacterium]|nr:DUF2330 domain-containing protein [Alphaproteobacteria bacterium]
MLTALALLTLGAPTPAHAFCGTYVGQAGADLYNGASQLVISREGTRTTLTLVNDYEGNLSEFALVVPVPEVLGEEDVQVVEPSAIARVDEYSAPRLVSYTCEDFAWDDQDFDSAAEDGGAGAQADGSVTVEAQFTAGEYEIVVLSAQESGGLLEWLTDNGYAVDASAADLLQEYIDGGSYFFAARVALEALPDDASYLSPLQFGYDAAVFSLPIRLGTLNSAGEQDLLLYILSDQGQTHISNYPQVEVENQCMYVESDWEDFGVFYNDRFGEAVSAQERAGWILEYGWAPSSCDPCSGDPLTAEDVAALGWQGDLNDAYFSRIHMRYAPEQVDQDLSLYGSNMWDFTQIRYIEYDPQLEDRFPLCVSGWSDDPGTCDDDPAEDPDDPDNTGEGTSTKVEPRMSCGAPVAPGAALALIGLLLAARRRRAQGLKVAVPWSQRTATSVMSRLAVMKSPDSSL